MPDLDGPRFKEQILVGVPAMRSFPHGSGLAAARDYMSLRDQAYDAVASGDAGAALDIAVQCLEEAARMAHRATADLIDAMRQAEKAASLQAGITGQRQSLYAERERLQGERYQIDAARQALEIERREFRAALGSAGVPGPARGKGVRAVHRRAPGAVLPDLNAALRPDPASASGPAQFMELLRQFRVWAGRPSYRDMAARDQRFTASALHAALGRDLLPRRHDVIDAIVAGCGGSDEDRQMWATAWRRLAMQTASGAETTEALTSPGALESA